MDFSKIENLGQAKSVLENLPSNPLQALLQEQLNDVVQKLRNSVAQHDFDASGDLRKSFVTTKPNFSNGTLEISVEAEYYWKFLNYGVNGSKINRGAPTWGKQPSRGVTFKQEIDSWIKLRGITPRGKVYKNSYDSMNFLIRKSIIEKGKKPTNFVDDVITPALSDKMSQEISNLVGRSIEVFISLQHS